AVAAVREAESHSAREHARLSPRRSGFNNSFRGSNPKCDPDWQVADLLGFLIDAAWSVPYLLTKPCQVRRSVRPKHEFDCQRVTDVLRAPPLCARTTPARPLTPAEAGTEIFFGDHPNDSRPSTSPGPSVRRVARSPRSARGLRAAPDRPDPLRRQPHPGETQHPRGPALPARHPGRPHAPRLVLPPPPAARPP